MESWSVGGLEGWSVGLGIGFEGVQTDSDDAKFLGNGFLGGAFKGQVAMGHANVVETNGLEGGYELCLRQSTANSRSPQVDVVANPFGQLVGDHDVGQLKPATGTEDSEDLL